MSTLEEELRLAREALAAANRELAEERERNSQERTAAWRRQDDDAEDAAALEATRAAAQRRAMVDLGASPSSSLSEQHHHDAPSYSPPASASVTTVTIRAPDATTRIKLDVALGHETVSDIVVRAAQKLGIRQQSAAQFLHLSQLVNENSALGAVDRFLDKSQTLLQQHQQHGASSSSSPSPKMNTGTLLLKFKHFKRHRSFSDDPMLQEWFFKQLHRRIVNNNKTEAVAYPVSEKLAVALAGLELQALFGDATGKKRHSYFDRCGLDAYLPAASVSPHPYEYWQDRLFAVHAKHRGLSPAAARAKYIALFAASSPFWGLTFFDTADRENRPFLIGIGEDGLFVFDSQKRDVLQALPFDQLLGWERSTTGIFVKKRGTNKMTLFASSRVQSKEMADLLSEYYMLLPRDVRDRLGIALPTERTEELARQLPDPANFESPIGRVPVSSLSSSPRASPPQQHRTLRDRVLAFYDFYAPEKRAQVDSLLPRFHGRDAELMAALVSKYGPEPRASPSLSPAPSTSTATAFEAPIARRRPVQYASRLEALKDAYVEHCQQQQQQHEPNAKLLAAVDRAIDNDTELDELDLSFSDPPVDDAHLAIIVELFRYVFEQATPQDPHQWRDNISLRRLSLAHERDQQKLTEYSVANICTLIRMFPSFSSVNLSYVPLDNRNDSDVAKALLTCFDLDTLVLRGCKISDRGFASSLLELFAMVPSKLKTLDLEHNALTQRSMAVLASVMENENCALTSLNVGYNQLDVAALETLIAALRRTQRLRTLDFACNPGGRAAPRKFADLVAAKVGIRDLNLAGSNITGNDTAWRIAVELKAKDEIRKINFSDNPIGATLTRQRHAGSGEITRDYPADFFAFLDVGVHCVIEALIMDRTDLHEDAGQALASVLQSNATLTELVVSNNALASFKSGVLPQSWTDMLVHNAYLRRLDLRHNGIAYLGLMKLFAAMAKNRSIEALVLDGNLFDRYTAAAAGASSPSSSTSSNLHGEIVAMLENNTALQALSLCDTCMKDDVLVKIGEGLRRNRSLKRLVASRNEFGVRGVTELALHLQENETLEFADLSCRSVQINNDLYLQAYRCLIERSNLETALL